MSEGPQVVHVLPDQEAALESHFRRNKNIHKSDVAILSAETGLDEELVQVGPAFFGEIDFLPDFFFNWMLRWLI